MKKLIFLLATMLVIASCQEVDLKTVNQTLASKKNNFAISQEEALENLSDFMEGFEPTARSSKRDIQNVIAVKYNRLSRSEEDAQYNCENLLYVANFTNSQGYAILSGDTRIPEPVLAVTDEGSINESEVYNAMTQLPQENNRVIFPQYPTTGKGLFRLPKYDNQLFMNPNTVNLYIDSINDTLVGNFEPTDTSKFDNKVPDNIYGGTLPDNLPTYLCASYALRSIRKGENDDWNRFQKDDNVPPNNNFPYTENDYFTVHSYSSWRITEQKYPLLWRTENWYQRKPFNDLYPERTAFILFWKRRKAPAGCFPLSIAKLITFYQGKIPVNNNGFIVDFSYLKWRNDVYKNETSALHAANLLDYIAKGCKCLYFYEGTFTFPWDAKKFMSANGMSNAKSYNYTFDIVKEMIDGNQPTIIYGMPGIDITKSHAWNIDGYKIKERSDTIRNYCRELLLSVRDTVITTKMVHCDFGWGKTHNGYYVSGIFKLNDENCEKDLANDPGTETTHYNTFLQVIKYTKP